MKINVVLGISFLLFALLCIVILFQPYMMMFLIFLVPLFLVYLIVGLRYMLNKRVNTVLAMVLLLLLFFMVFPMVLGVLLYPLNYVANPTLRIPLGEFVTDAVVAVSILSLAIYNMILVSKK